MMQQRVASIHWLRENRWRALSGALHLLLLTALLYRLPPRIVPVDHPGDRYGHQVQLTYTPGHAPATDAPSSRPVPKPPPPTRAALTLPKPLAPPPPPASAAANSAPIDKASGTSSDALGTGNVTVALVVLHPPPRPDLSQLPSGTRGDVIIDVVIDATGRITSTTMASGLGHGIDEIVLATIQQWTFQPATRNGTPVASEQELLFHYERG